MRAEPFDASYVQAAYADSGVEITKRPRLNEYPVVAEVRKARSAIWKEAGGTMAKLQRWLDAAEKAGAKKRASRKKRGGKSG